MFGAKAFIDRSILVPIRRREAAAATAAAGAAPAGAQKGKKKKAKGSFAENFAVLKSSAKIRNLALLVMGYGVAHRLFEFAWKGQLRVLHPTVQGYQSVLADVSTLTGRALGRVGVGMRLAGWFRLCCVCICTFQYDQ